MNNPVHRQRILKCGWLKKQGGMVKTWHRRWFCLNGDCLFYFAKHDDLKPLGSIFLPGNRVDEQPFNPDEPEKFMFEVLPGRVQTKMAPNHDSFLLCADSDDERQAWIQAIRRVMYSGIGGAIFGQSIAETMSFCKRQDLKVPVIVKDCVEFLTKYGLETEGIFRMPGRSVMIREYKLKYDTAEKVVFDISNIDVHSVASLLKLYLRELPQSIIPSSCYQRFMNIALRYQDARESNQKQEALDSLVEGMKEIPRHNYNILKYLCNFLHEVGEKSSINKMTTINLATVFGPNIIRNVMEADSPELMMATADLTQQLAFMLINHKDQIFTMEYDGPSAVQVDLLVDIDSDTLPSTETLQPTPVHNNDLVHDIFRQLEFKNTDDDDPEVFNSLDSVESADSTTHSTAKNADTKNFTEGGKPIPPKRRAKSTKIARGRRVNDRIFKTPSISSASDDMDSSNNSSSWSLSNTLATENGKSASQENLASDQISEPNSQQLAVLLAKNEKLEKELKETSKQNKELHWEVIEGKSKFELQQTDLKSKYEAQLCELKSKYKVQQYELKSRYEAQMKKVRQSYKELCDNYERRIQTLETESKGKLKELESKLLTESNDKKLALDRVVQLQSKINQYQLQYGELQSPM